MSYGHMFGVSVKSQVLGVGRYRFTHLLNANSRDVYFRFDDGIYNIVSKNNGKFILSSFGNSFFARLFAECGAFHYCYVALQGKHESEREFADYFLGKANQAENVRIQTEFIPRDVYIYTG